MLKKSLVKHFIPKKCGSWLKKKQLFILPEDTTWIAHNVYLWVFQYNNMILKYVFVYTYKFQKSEFE